MASVLRQMDNEAGTFAYRALHFDAASVRVDDRSDKTQTQPKVGEATRTPFWIITRIWGTHSRRLCRCSLGSEEMCGTPSLELIEQIEDSPVQVYTPFLWTEVTRKTFPKADEHLRN